MTRDKLAAIRKRHEIFRELEGALTGQLCNDIAALLDHIDRYAELTPDVLDMSIAALIEHRWHGEPYHRAKCDAARDVLERLREQMERDQ